MIIRRLRGALGVALTWSLVWGIARAVIVLVDAFSGSPEWSHVRLATLYTDSPDWAVIGGIGGLTFAAALAVAARRDIRVDSVGRMATIGATGAVIVLVSWVLVSTGELPPLGNAPLLLTLVALAAMSAAITFILARPSSLRASAASQCTTTNSA